MIDTIEVTEVPVERVTPLKPSDAMRLGRMLYPERCEGDLAQPLPEGGWAVCALGAVAVGYGESPRYISDKSETASHKELARIEARCPIALKDDLRCGERDTAFDVVWHLNDDHEWPTERIASWLEGLGL